MDRIYIIDAVNYLFRSYHAIGPAMSDGQGRSTGALYGFIRSVQKLLKEFSPEYCVIVFDGPDNKKSRQAVYADYKMHRKKAPEDLYPQFEWAYKFCELAGLPVLCVDGVEADDTMATVAVWAADRGAEVFLCSSDKDLLQLIKPGIFALHAHKDNLLVDSAKVEELFGVRPDQMVDYLALTGDASDNVPGVEGFGPKTVSTLLQEHGTLDAILAHPERVNGPKKQEALRTQKDTALMSRELVQLDLHVEVPHDEKFYHIRESEHEKLAAFYQEMSFHSLMRTQIAQPEADRGSEYILVDDERALADMKEALESHEEICVDTETTGLDPLRAECVGIGLCAEAGKAWYLPCNGALGKEKICESLQTLFSKHRFYGHNLKYDLHILSGLGIEPTHLSFDTLIASYLLRPQNRLHNLDTLALEQFQKAKIPIESLIGKGKSERSMADAPIEQVKDYCCEDVDYTCRLKRVFTKELKQSGLESIFYNIEMPLIPILTRMEREGIRLNPEALKEVGQELFGEVERMRKKIFDAIGEEFNINSPKQLAEMLHKRLGLMLPKGSTRADVLESLSGEEPILEEILEYRASEKLRSTYVEALLEAINPNTGRIHCNFNQLGAATGRLSCQDPNLQNIPVRSEAGRQIRSCFIPRGQGWSFLSADYSQIELRLLAHFSKDPELLHAFCHGQDVHRRTASLVFGVPLDQVTSEMRSQAKAVNFGIVYGQGAYGLSRQLHIPVHEASHFIQTYFKRYARVLEYTEECVKEARKTGETQTIMGRKRPIPDIHSKNASIRAAAERLAVNTPLQGTAADLLKMAMIAIDHQIKNKKMQSKMLLQIHDELLFEAPNGELEELEAVVKSEMEGVMKLEVPLKVDFSIGKNWGECYP